MPSLIIGGESDFLHRLEQVGIDCRRASRRGAKVQCEMGGKNPVVIMEDADMDWPSSQLRKAHSGHPVNAAPPRSAVVVHDVADEFVERLQNVRHRCVLVRQRSGH